MVSRLFDERESERERNLNELFYFLIEETFKELERMLILLIGCAINGDSKELFIENIQLHIDTQTQIELVPYIELVTEDMSFSISKNLKLALEHHQNNHSPDTSISSSTSSFIQTCQQLIQNTQQTASSNSNNSNANTNGSNCNNNNNENMSPNDVLINKLLNNIQRIIDERDLCSESVIELQQDKDFLLKQLNKNGLFLLNNHNSTSNSNNLDSSSASNCGDVNNEMIKLMMMMNRDCNNMNTGSDHNQLADDDYNRMNKCDVNSKSNNSSNNNNMNINSCGNNGGSKQQKLSLELVEYKVKMRQLRMEM